MTNKLDFIVFGVGRSGTTATARYLNAIDPIHCGIEAFPHFEDHSVLTGPESFLNHPFFKQDAMPVRISREDITAKGDKIKVWGNKMPSYFYRLNGVLGEIGKKKALMCVRNIEDVARSFTTRANNEKDTWNNGRIGMYAICDFIIELLVLSSLDPDADIMVIPYEALDNDWQGTMSAAAQFVAPEFPPDFNPERIAFIEAQKLRKKRVKKAPLTETERATIERIGGSDIAALFSRATPYNFSEVRDALPELVAKLPKQPINFIRRKIETYEDPNAADFLKTYLRRVRPTCKRLKSLNETHQSEHPKSTLV